MKQIRSCCLHVRHEECGKERIFSGRGCHPIGSFKTTFVATDHCSSLTVLINAGRRSLLTVSVNAYYITDDFSQALLAYDFFDRPTYFYYDFGQGINRFSTISIEELLTI